MLDEQEIRRTLSRSEFDETEADDVVKTIASWLNDISTHDRGREFLIRLLAKRDGFPSYHYDLIDDLVRSAGLLPYAGQPKNLLDAILREAHAAPGLKDNAVFHSLQLQVFQLLMSGRNVVLSATTSVGKSMIVDAVIASKRFKKIVVIVPTIALIDETRRRISRSFGGSHAIITHPSQEPDDVRPTVYVLTQERVLARDDLKDVEFFVVDEFYKLDLDGADSRAVDLNLAFHRLASSGAQFYLIGPSVSEVRGIAARFQHIFIPSTFSTVALDIEHFNLGQHTSERAEKLLELVDRLESQTLIYCQSPSKCGEVAKILIESEKFPKNAATVDAVDWLSNEFPSEWIVIEALKRGIGIHHGNVPRAIQHYMIKCFERGEILFLICTSTIIEGVNTVAQNIIIYDKRIKNSTIDSFTFRNIAGRAGRMGQWFVGRVFVLEGPIEAEAVTVTLPIEEQDDSTPISLLLDLPEDDLSNSSRVRIEIAVEQSSLTRETLRANRHIPVDAQRLIAEKIRRDLIYREALNWKGMPSTRELSTACELIYDFIDQGKSLKSYQIFNGAQLAASLMKLGTMTLKEFVENRVQYRRQDQSISDAVESALRFLRSYVVHTFPRQISAVNTVYNDIGRSSGFSTKADYSLFAVKCENLFMESGLFALDEYGVPPQTAYRLGLRHHGIDSLDKALQMISELTMETERLHPFEYTLLEELQRSIGSNNRSIF